MPRVDLTDARRTNSSCTRVRGVRDHAKPWCGQSAVRRVDFCCNILEEKRVKRGKEGEK